MYKRKNTNIITHMYIYECIHVLYTSDLITIATMVRIRIMSAIYTK